MAEKVNKLRQQLLEKNKNRESRLPVSSKSLFENNYHADLIRKLKETNGFEKIAERLERDDKTVYKIPLSSLEDAPVEWNFFKKLSDDKMIELMDSILQIGLLNPLIVWEMKGLENDKKGKPTYKILSGHNRARAYKLIYESSGDDEYKYIPSFIFQYNELTEDDAKNIIIDSNYVNRVLNKKERTESVKFKYLYYHKVKEEKPIDKVAQDLNLKPRIVRYYYSISQLYEGIKELVYNDRLPIRAAAKLSMFTIETQKWLLDNFGDSISQSFCSYVKAGMTKEMMATYLNGERNTIRIGGDEKNESEKQYCDVISKVPINLVDKFKLMVAEWISNNSE